MGKKRAKNVQGIALTPPDPALRNAIKKTLDKSGEKKSTRRQMAGKLLLSWLADHGRFVQNEVSERYYLYRPTHKLYRLKSELWDAWLFSLTGVYPATVDFTCLVDECKAVAIFAPRQPVVRVSAWDADEKVLRVSRFDGMVYRLDGKSIEDEANGEGVLFDDDPLWLPYKPVFTKSGVLGWSTETLPNWERDADVHGLAYRVWVLTTFFTELCPSRPYAMFLGEKNSGKSTALRVLLKLMFGPIGQVSGVPDKRDGFTALASSSHLLVLDNVDQFKRWLQDKLARLATGARDHYRQLYTGNERGDVIYRCWLALTARTPDTLKRDDLADRLLLLPVGMIPEIERKKETDMYVEAAASRGQWWGEVLLTANQAVASIRRGDLVGPPQLRMADWEALGRIFAKNESQEPLWDKFCRDLRRAQSGFLLADNLIVEGLDAWLTIAANPGREMTGKELHQELGGILFRTNKPSSDWPKSVVGFGKRLAGIRRDLKTIYRVEWETKSHREVYRFWPDSVITL